MQDYIARDMNPLIDKTVYILREVRARFKNPAILWCHDEQTQVLTDEGIKNYCDIKLGDKILGMKDGKLVETSVVRRFQTFYSGPMCCFHSTHYDLAITPDHEIYFKSRYDKDFKKRPAKAVRTIGNFKVTFGWDGKRQDAINIHDFITVQWRGHKKKKQSLESINTDAFLELIGWYLAEGSLFKCNGGPYVQLRTANHCDEIKTLLNSLGLSFGFYENSRFVIFHHDLAIFLKTKCGEYAWGKRIPKEFLQLSKDHLMHLFTSYMKGDGGDNGYRATTVSEALRDQLIVLALKLGFYGRWDKRPHPKRPRFINGRKIEEKHQAYRLSFAFNAVGGYKQDNNFTAKQYNGNVWCFETDTGNFLTIRNGKPALSGNSTGKDSTCTIHLAKDALREKLDWPIVHMDTGLKFPEIYEFRDRLAKEWDLNLVIAKNDTDKQPDNHLECCFERKTLALKQLFQKEHYDAIIVSIRWDEHPIRGMERYFSPRDHKWHWNVVREKTKEEMKEGDAPVLSLTDTELAGWNIYATDFGSECSHVRVHPILHWTEIEMWQYIKKYNLPFNPLYLSNGTTRYRSLGCSPCTKPVESKAATIDEIIEELTLSKIAERAGRMNTKEGDMEKLRFLGYM